MFKRGFWRCQVAGCGDDAVLAFKTIVGTPGGRGHRIQKSTDTVRLCMVDARELANGVIPPALAAGIKKTIKAITGDECQPLKNRK